MHTILKKRSREVDCQSSVKFLAKCCNLKGGGHKQKRGGVGPAGRKTKVLSKPPPYPPVSLSNADGYLSQTHSQILPETMVKYCRRLKRGARLGKPQKGEEKMKSQVTFSSTSTDLGAFRSYNSIDYDLDEDETISQGAGFNPELVTAHCFRRFKEKDFHLPQSRRRIIIVPGTKDQVPAHPTMPPQAPPPPIPTFKALDIREIQEPPMDRKVWLSKRAKLRAQLESFGDVKTWLENKPTTTPSEAKVLLLIRQEENTPEETLISIRKPKGKVPRPVRQPIPQLRLPKPSFLADLYTYLRNRKIKILEAFGKAERGENQHISREEFIMSLKAIGVPLKNQELEDIIIYLGSLGKQNAITTNVLASTYKQWSLAQQRSTLPTAREYYNLTMKRTSLKHTLQKHQAASAWQPRKMDLLKVPEVDTKMEGRPMTKEDKEEVGKRYQERRRKYKVLLPSTQGVENYQLVRSGKKHLPSTISGEMEELVNMTRKDDFLVYLKCWELCKTYGLPLTEDILMRALLYPGDKIISLREEVRCPIRQPGGYYIDKKIGFRTHGIHKPGAKKTDKKPSKKLKKMHFQEFKEFTRKSKTKRLSSPPRTHPNHFWPGHLLDKLRLYLPTVARDQSQAIFSCVEPKPHVYSATYHSKEWWPLKHWAYLTQADYDAHKVYSIT